MKTVESPNISDSTYFRTGDAEPTIEADGTITLLNGRGTRRGWGAPQVNSMILVDAEDFLAVLVGFSHKHGGGQFYRYYIAQGGGVARRTWAQLTDDERSLVLAAYEKNAPNWAHRPGKLSTERKPPTPQTWLAYKVLRQMTDGRLLSFYDETTWTLGENRVEYAKENHSGGYYVRECPAEVGAAEFVDWLRDEYRRGDLVTIPNGEGRIWHAVVMAVECRGKRIEYSSGKIAVSQCKPLSIVEKW